MLRIPHTDDMTDEIFLKHMDKRHSQDLPTSWHLLKIQHISDGWMLPLRAFHSKMHELALPGQYDHEHREREEESAA